MEESNKKKYEVTFWLKDENPEAAKSVFAKHGVEVLAERPLSKFSLSYPIKKTAAAFLASFVCAVDPAEIGALKTDIDAVPTVLRSLVNVAEERKIQANVAATEGVAVAPRRGIFGRRSRTESAAPVDVLTNEALEKKIEEISK